MRRVVILAEAAEDIEAARDFSTRYSPALATTARTHSWPISKVLRSTTVFMFGNSGSSDVGGSLPIRDLLSGDQRRDTGLRRSRSAA